MFRADNYTVSATPHLMNRHPRIIVRILAIAAIIGALVAIVNTLTP